MADKKKRRLIGTNWKNVERFKKIIRIMTEIYTLIKQRVR